MEPASKKDFIGYEYKEIAVQSEYASFYMDCYESFGWQPDEHQPPQREGKMTVFRLKRNRKLVNKTELTRLQRHFEACADQIRQMEQKKTSMPLILALSVGLMGTVCMAGSTFAVTHEPPVIWLCILLAVPGFAGWILPYFLYKNGTAAQARKLQPLIESRQEEIYEICEKGHSLL